jgi:hypothetical protein
MILSQLHPPLALTVHLPKIFLIVVYSTNNLRVPISHFPKSLPPKLCRSIYFCTKNLREYTFYLLYTMTVICYKVIYLFMLMTLTFPPAPHSCRFIHLPNLLQLTGIDQTRDLQSVITYPVDRMNNAIGGRNITILYCGAANVDMSFMISPNSYRLPTEGLNTIGKWPGCGTHSHTAESLCNGNICVHDQLHF